MPDDGAYSLVAAVWRPGQRTAVHDHIAWCVVGVHRGEEHEIRYRLVDDHLVEDGHTVGPCGEVTVLTPPGDIHAVVNDGTDGRGVAARVRRRPAQARHQRPPLLRPAGARPGAALTVLLDSDPPSAVTYPGDVSRIVVLDYGSGNLRSAERALRRVGADVTVTADRHAAMEADGLVVPGVGAFAACMAGLRAVDGPSIIDHRLAGGRPVLGICVGMQVLFERGVEWDERTEGCGQWPGTVERLKADVLPHMGWNTVSAPAGSTLFAGAGRRHPLLLRAQLRSAPVGDGGVDGDAPAARDLGAPRRGLRGRRGERRAGRHPVPPGEVRRRRCHGVVQLAARCRGLRPTTVFSRMPGRRSGWVVARTLALVERP